MSRDSKVQFIKMLRAQDIKNCFKKNVVSFLRFKYVFICTVYIIWKIKNCRLSHTNSFLYKITLKILLLNI